MPIAWIAWSMDKIYICSLIPSPHTQSLCPPTALSILLCRTVSVQPSLPHPLRPTLFTQILCPVLSAQPSPSNPLSSTLFTQLSLPNPLCPNLSAQVWASTAVICIGLIGIPQLHCMPRVYSMDIPSDGCPHMSITLVVLRYTHTRSLYFAHSHYGNGVHTHVMVWPLTM